MNLSNKSRGVRLIKYLLMVCLLCYVVVYMPTPYIIYQPGSAEEVKPMITVKNGDESEAGTFMMTTVSASYANIALLAISSFNPNAEVDKKQSRLGNKSKEEYAAEQLYYMSDSQSSAVEAAYREAGVAYQIIPQYLFVFSIPEDSRNSDYFQPGDKILEVDKEPISDNLDLTTKLKNRKIGEIVTLKLERSGQVLEENVPLVSIRDNETNSTRAGFGIMIGTMQKVTANDQSKQVEFKNTNVGGPSAGLIFTMEIFNQLTPGDLTKGYRVAGTGTITVEGKVGPIGGVKHKIVAADREQAQLFFVPKDNYEEAKTKAEEIGTSMKLIPVSTLEEALKYMEQVHTTT
ncbi:SepM family pheromone-processing serine protease [Paenibacillus crassostreae]|uniref:endopeptidase La n=1 Tax=Paenibacillus crassostreae TaxID=1763538 RepID=A0A167FQ11_9BACL|nr:SepM family pheromone-processing serine protease [Paenibacillus crassostreae]AOZ94180.1 peptidase S16 [Paenibacillus crassostreae]OAB76784.1 peptidase S16 [Paenibacillus crassostreae]